MIKGACYVRVSTENQLENYSIEEQIDRLKGYCKAKDITIIKFYTDGGYSGGNINRPALQQMIKDIEHGDIDSVIVYKLDRLSRSQKETLLLIEDKFLANGVDFISINENFDTSTPFGRAMIGILSVFAQLEKDQITERFTMGRIGRAKNGYFHGGAYAPTGYDYIDGQLIVNDYEALQVKELYMRFLKGYSIHNCWQYMQKHYTTKYGAWKSEALVGNVLRNELYIGKVKFKGVSYPGNHVPIIDSDLFYKVQDIFKTSRGDMNNIKHTPFRSSSLLSSFIYCGKCGAKFHTEHGNYSCYSRTKGDKKYIVDPNCKNKKWKINDLDNLVVRYISELNYKKIEKISTSTEVPRDYSNRIKEIDKQIEKLIDLYQIDSIPIHAISEKINNLSKEKSVLEEISNIEIPDTTIESQIQARDRLLNILETGELQEKRACLSVLVDHIEINDESVNIVLKSL